MSVKEESRVCDCNYETNHRSDCQYYSRDIFVYSFGTEQDLLIPKGHPEQEWTKGFEHNTDSECPPFTVKVEKKERECSAESKHDFRGDVSYERHETNTDGQIIEKSEPVIEDFKIEILNHACTSLSNYDVVDVKDVGVKIEDTKSKQTSKSFKCNRCDYVTTWKGVLLQHVRIKHSGEKAFKCSKCNFTAASKLFIEKHMLKHPGKKLLKHDQCNFSTARKNYSSTHVMKRPTKFKCDQCDFSTAGRIYLSRHVMRRHTKEKPFKCDKCDYNTADKHCLSIHIMRRHTEEKPFKCDKCDYGTADKLCLSRHFFRRHTKEKPFKCDRCDFRTAYKHYLLTHTKRH